jgi:hypothetical protein
MLSWFIPFILEKKHVLLLKLIIGLMHITTFSFTTNKMLHAIFFFII